MICKILHYCILIILSQLTTITVGQVCSFSNACMCEQAPYLMGTDRFDVKCYIGSAAFPTFATADISKVESILVYGNFSSIPKNAFSNLSNGPAGSVTIGTTSLEIHIDEDAFVNASVKELILGLPLTAVPIVALSKAKNLKSLSITGCNFNSLPAGAFAGLRLEKIWLSCSTLVNINDDAFQGK